MLSLLTGIPPETIPPERWKDTHSREGVMGMTVGAVLVTCGQSADGAPLDPLEELGACSAVQRMVRTLQNGGVRRIILLTDREQGEQVEKHMAHWGVVCRQYGGQASQAAALQEGVHALNGRCDRLIFGTVDTPFLSVDTVAALIASSALLARPMIHGRPGGILCLSSTLFHALLAAPPELPVEQLAELLDVAETGVPVEDEGALAGQRAYYAQLLERRRREPIQITFKLRLCRERPFFGPGTVQLLQLIDETESVRLACQRMGVSYSKGWKMIAVMEEELGECIVLRRQGGKNGGAASLTQAGRDLLDKYQRLERRCQALVQQASREIFQAAQEE